MLDLANGSDENDTKEAQEPTELPNKTENTGVFLGDITDNFSIASHSTAPNATPPNCVDAERALLSALLWDGTVFDEVAAEGIKPTDFYAPIHAAVYKAMQQLNAQGNPISPITLMDEIFRWKELDKSTVSGFFSNLESDFPTASHAIVYARLVIEKSTLRRLIKIATTIIQSAYRQEKKVTEVMNEAETAILSIRSSGTQKGIFSFNDLAADVIKRYQSLSTKEMLYVGIPSGFKDLDYFTSGFQPGELVVVAARPSMGKTAFTLNVASHISIHLQKPVAFFSLEMSAEQLVHRIIGSECRLDLSDLRRGNISTDQFSNLISMVGNIGKAPLYIDETPSITVPEMRNKCRQLKHKHGIELVIVDYLQLMQGPEGYDNKATEVAEISKGLKSIAREFKIPVIALSQLNRGVESRTDKRPMMSDLRESGAIEQDADVIAFLYREEYYLRDKTPEDKLGIAEVIVSKNRNGPTGSLELRFFNNITRFVSLEKDHNSY